jgi:CRISPR-associated endonuclease/helicase Cas3
MNLRGETLNIESLDECFRALTGYAPYRWQRRLYECLVAGEKYTALDLPTGLGKTSIIPLWILARAAGADLPRRLVYVVDRRAVVDQATAVADEIARRLHRQATGVAAELRAALGLTDEATLPVSTLRGQHVDNRRWLENPGATAIVVGTVDMIGSRLLFEGYGVSRRMRPVHAGLLGVDSLIVIDEAHLVPPFEALVRQAAAIGDDDWGNAPGRLASSLQLMSLSATGRERAGATVFRLAEEDMEDPPVRARLKAPKRLRLLPEVTPNALVERLAETAWAYGEGGRRVVVFCNSRKTAQAVEADLGERVKTDKDRFGKGVELTELLVGERRYRERLFLTGDQGLQIAASPVFARFAPGAAPDSEGRPAFLVATSAGDVGVDLDADDLVCDLVAWERMVQRLGRVNRRSNPGEARVAIIPVAKEKEAEDDISDEALKVFRAPFDSPAWPDGDDGAKDASPENLRRLRLEPVLAAVLQAASTPEPLRPPLTRPTLASWSLTTLEQHTGRPKVQPWLRGWAESEPQTTVIWRRLFPLRADEEIGQPSRDLKAFFETAAPPHISESLSAPSRRVAQILRECAGVFRKASLKTGSATRVDTGPSDDDSDRPAKHRPVVVVLSADQSVDELYSVERLAEADVETLARSIANGTVVVDARLRGLDENGLLDAKAKTEPVTIDVQPAALWRLPLQTTSARRITLGDRPAKEKFWKLDEFRWAESDKDDADGLWVEVWRGPGDNPGDPAVSKYVQTLSDHHSHTGRHAAQIAEGLGLISPWRELLVAAAEAHDLGKARALWQNAMNARRDDGRPYAKTEGGGDGRALNGYRHEFGSLRDVLLSPEAYLPPVVADDPDRRDLALHLILAHHGWGRPSIKAYDPDQIPSRSPAIAQEAALRFAKLQARWGAWGLAWWESLLRAADWAASRELNEQPESDAAVAHAKEPADG